MQFTVAKRDLEHVLNIVSNTVGNTTDIYSHLVFQLTEDKTGVRVLSSDGRIFSSSPLNCSVSDDTHSAFTIEAKRLKGKSGWLGAVSDAALTFDFDGKIVKATSPRGSISFRSLDPNDFPFWDSALEGTKPTAKMDAGKLASVLNYSKDFVSEDSAVRPQFCVVEVKDGELFSACSSQMSIIRVPELLESSLRIHGKNLKSHIAFLNTIDYDVEIWESDKLVVMKVADGSVFGEMRFRMGFPDLPDSRKIAPDHHWVLPVEDIVQNVKFLIPCANPKDTGVIFSFVDENTVMMGMRSETGKMETLSLKLKCDPSSELYEGKDFKLPYPILLKVLESLDTDDVRVDINAVKGKKGGLVQFNFDQNGDAYQATIPWLIF